MLDPDLDEFLKEYRLQPSTEPVCHYEDGELEAEWLVVAGFPQLTHAYSEGRELPINDLTTILSNLSKTHANAVKQRVKVLNRTVRGRGRTRISRKPDIRDVFRDVDASSTGTRSRSATPDSLDSAPGDDPWNSSNHIPNFVSIFDNSPRSTPIRKQNLRRTPSAPLRGSAELFRGSQIRCDIPFYTEGIELLGFQRLGTLHIPRVRSGSDPSCSIGRSNGHLISTLTRSHNSLYEATSHNDASKSPENSSPRNSSIDNSVNASEPVSFENMCRESYSNENMCWQENKEPCVDVENISEMDLKRLQTLLWLELAALFDKNNVAFDKRKPFKRKRKEEGNLFGVSLNALIRRDQQVTGEDSTLVPLILQGILRELTDRGAKEEGILRVPGHKQKTEILYNELEQNFYARPDSVNNLLNNAGIHDLSALLKRWLRELPQPLLANDLIHLFYQTHALPPQDQHKALSVLCLLIPHENRNTLRALLTFLKEIINMEHLNKMTKHNVATIIAPSLFSPRFLQPVDKSDISAQVRIAAQCCQLTSVIISNSESLWMVSQRLLNEARKGKQNGQMKRHVARKTKVNINSIDMQLNTNRINKIVI